MSFLALYCQFLQAKYDLRARLLSIPSVNHASDITGNGPLVFSITNAGYRDAVLVDIKVATEGIIAFDSNDKPYLSNTGALLVPVNIIGDLPAVLTPGKTIIRKLKFKITPKLLNARYSSHHELEPNNGVHKTNLIIAFASIDAVGNSYTASKGFVTILWTKKEIIETTFYYNSINLFADKQTDWSLRASYPGM